MSLYLSPQFKYMIFHTLTWRVVICVQTMYTFLHFIFPNIEQIYYMIQFHGGRGGQGMQHDVRRLEFRSPQKYLVHCIANNQ